MFCKVQEREILPGDSGVATAPRVALSALLPVAPDVLDFFSLISL